MCQDRKLSASLQSNKVYPVVRLNILVTWLSANSVDVEVKEEILQTLNFDDFTGKQLASAVRKSGLYPADKIIERMDQLLEKKEGKIRMVKEEIRKENDRLKYDMSIV